MSRLSIETPDRAQQVVEDLCRDMGHRIAANPPGLCPVDMALNFLRLCHAQTCGKCVPCRIGLSQLETLIESVLDQTAPEGTIDLIESTAAAIADSADCAIGYEAAAMVLEGVRGFREDYEEHAHNGRCICSLKQPVPCVTTCPAHVDIPGYIALVREGRFDDAVDLIRKDNPFPYSCAYVCEHPCERQCRRRLVDDAVNICGLKRYAVDHCTRTAPPPAAPATGKRVAVVGGGPSGLTAAYYLSQMGHSVTVFEQREKLGGMLRYGIPDYRLPPDVLDHDIDYILAAGVEVKTGVCVGREVQVPDLQKDYDAVYVAIGAHADKKLGLEGEDSENVLSAVELLRNCGEGNAPDFTGKRVVVIGGGNVSMDATRTAIRLGAESVTCVYRRRVDDMTALPEEIEDALAEGCQILPLQAPHRIEAATPPRRSSASRRTTSSSPSASASSPTSSRKAASRPATARSKPTCPATCPAPPTCLPAATRSPARPPSSARWRRARWARPTLTPFWASTTPSARRCASRPPSCPTRRPAAASSQKAATRWRPAATSSWPPAA